MIIFVTLAIYVGHELLTNPGGRLLEANWTDQVLIEWFLANDTRVFTGGFTLVTDRLNAPEGVNLMSNASHILHGVLLAPVTWLFGVPASFAVALAGNLAATAFCWYLLLRREVAVRPVPAVVGGMLAGFAPGMLSQSQGHLHITAGWLAPLLVWCLVRLLRTERPVRVGALLGVLTALHLFLGEEVLYLTALASILFVLSYVAMNWTDVRPRLARAGLGAAVAVVLATALLAYPLWVQFAGPQHLTTAPFPAEYFSADLYSWIQYSPLSLGGREDVETYAPNATELNTYLGLPLVLVAVAATAALWRRRPVVRPLAVTGLVLAALSLGPEILVAGEATGIPGPYRLIEDLPVIDAALPTRYALAVVPMVAVILALALDAVTRDSPLMLRICAPIAALVALVPLLPTPLSTMDRPPLPAFIADGHWRDCVPEGGVLVPVPPPTPGNPITMRWPADDGVAYGVPEGFFLGPYGENGRTSMGVYPRPTSALWRSVWETAEIPEIVEGQRIQARADLDYWNADCVAIGPGPRQDELVVVTTALLGLGERVADTVIWRWNPA